MQTLTADQLTNWKQEDQEFLLLNVLDRQAFEAQHIPGSRNVPVQSSGFEVATEKLAGSKQQPVVVYCAGPECDASTQAARKLDAAGFEQVYDFEGGTQAWKDSDRPLAEGSAS